MLKLPPAVPTRTPRAQAESRKLQAENIEILNQALGDINFSHSEEEALISLSRTFMPSDLRALISAFEKAQPARELAFFVKSPPPTEIDR